jgi:predicted TIM-barrel enzyme
VGGSGVINGSAGKILRRRKELAAEHIKVFADVKKKHGSHSLTIDLDIQDEIRQAEFFLADGVIVTGAATGIEASPQDVSAAAGAVCIPVLVGSGIAPSNVGRFADAHGYIVGSAVKQGGHWSNPLDRDAVHAMARAFAALGDPS